MRKEIKEFLRSNKKVLKLTYKGRKLNAGLAYREFFSPITTSFRFVIFELLQFFPGGKIKNNIYKIFGVKIGKDVLIGPKVLIDPSFPNQITIEDGAIIGWGSKILTHEVTIHHVRIGKVKIGRKALIGSFSLIRSGVSIGEGAVVAMGSVVNKDVKKLEEVGGVPDKEIRKLKKEL